MWRTHAEDKRVPETFVRLVLRALWRRAQELRRKKKGETIPFWESYDSVAALMDHKHGAGIAAEHNVVNRHVAQKVVTMAAMSSLPMPDVNNDDANLLHAKIKANSARIETENSSHVGLGLYPFFSMLNHSDSPAAIQRFHKGVLSIAAIRPIAAGEEVTITYADLAEPSFDRRRHLLRHFHFDSRPDLPHTKELHVERTHRFNIGMRACLLHESETAGLAAREEDAALCEVKRPEDYPEGHNARYCWACITTPANDPGERVSLYDAEGCSVEDGGEMWEGAPDEEDRGDWDSFCAPADVRRVLTQGWSASHVETFGPSSSRTSMPLWQQQVLNEQWKIVVRLFGDWNVQDAADDARWLEVASAAAYGIAGCKWSKCMLGLGEEELGVRMAVSVEGACMKAGLADTHQSLLEARSIIFQNSKAAMRSLTGELKDNPMHKQVVDATMLYGSMLLPAYMKVYPPACDTTGMVYHALADCQMLMDFKEGGVEYLEKAYECLRIVHGAHAPHVRLLKGKLLSSKATTSEEFEEAARLLNM